MYTCYAPLVAHAANWGGELYSIQRSVALLLMTTFTCLLGESGQTCQYTLLLFTEDDFYEKRHNRPAIQYTKTKLLIINC